MFFAFELVASFDVVPVDSFCHKNSFALENITFLRLRSFSRLWTKYDCQRNLRMPKLQAYKDRYWIVVPKNHIEVTGQQKGQELIVQQNGGNKLIIKNSVDDVAEKCVEHLINNLCSAVKSVVTFLRSVLLRLFGIDSKRRLWNGCLIDDCRF